MLQWIVGKSNKHISNLTNNRLTPQQVVAFRARHSMSDANLIILEDAMLNDKRTDVAEIQGRHPCAEPGKTGAEDRRLMANHPPLGDQREHALSAGDEDAGSAAAEKRDTAE